VATRQQVDESPAQVHFHHDALQVLDSLDGVASQLVSLITADLQRAEPLFFNSTRTLYGQILTRLDGIDSSFRQSSIAWEGALEQVGG
jgi:hypothetical protein